MAKYTVEFDTNDKQEEALLELLPYWQQYTSKEDGSSRPFEHYTIADLFEVLMQIGSLTLSGTRLKKNSSDRGKSRLTSGWTKSI